jgi:hypothetical protein
MKLLKPPLYSTSVYDPQKNNYWGSVLERGLYEFSLDLSLPAKPGHLIINLEDGSTLDYIADFSMNGYFQTLVKQGYKIKTVEIFYYTEDILIPQIKEPKEDISKSIPLF